ncbi:MAG: hydrogenase maturation nickel metallochaperone HypA [Acidobacteriota bacterium]|nr:hydrogenase maturation nickel metallochaperone HypA [Acidobacteriota bacterium]MDW3228280.1 hydrogenase maturation nickel metallochaperone HypA [Acidobacteriota bacterium]MDY0230874.1 hydrogenase maturation nickel metallochaperone HypA [Candidatus Saccharicenans sp.]
MHELSLVADLFTIIEEQASRAGAKRVTKVSVSVGELAGVVPELFRSAFQSYKKGTIADKARLQLKMVKIKFKCRNCGHELTTRNIMDESFSYVCPACGSKDMELIAGRDLYLEKLEIET